MNRNMKEDKPAAKAIRVVLADEVDRLSRLARIARARTRTGDA